MIDLIWTEISIFHTSSSLAITELKQLTIDGNFLRMKKNLAFWVLTKKFSLRVPNFLPQKKLMNKLPVTRLTTNKLWAKSYILWASVYHQKLLSINVIFSLIGSCWKNLVVMSVSFFLFSSCWILSLATFLSFLR